MAVTNLHLRCLNVTVEIGIPCVIINHIIWIESLQNIFYKTNTFYMLGAASDRFYCSYFMLYFYMIGTDCDCVYCSYVVLYFYDWHSLRQFVLFIFRVIFYMIGTACDSVYCSYFVFYSYDWRILRQCVLLTFRVKLRQC